jgi:hypothetical protein
MVDAKPIVISLVGAVLIYSGVKNLKISAVSRDLISGKNPADLAAGTASANAGTGSSDNDEGNYTPGPGDGSGGSPDANQTLARSLAPKSWRTGQNWTDWVALWNQESGWSNTADTRKSGLDPASATDFAYGIAQARPYTKMPKSAWPPDKGGTSDPRAQIIWGIHYIMFRYGNPANAEVHEQTHGWY